MGRCESMNAECGREEQGKLAACECLFNDLRVLLVSILFVFDLDQDLAQGNETSKIIAIHFHII